MSLPNLYKPNFQPRLVRRNLLQAIFWSVMPSVGNVALQSYMNATFPNLR